MIISLFIHRCNLLPKVLAYTQCCLRAGILKPLAFAYACNGNPIILSTADPAWKSELITGQPLLISH